MMPEDTVLSQKSVCVSFILTAISYSHMSQASGVRFYMESAVSSQVEAEATPETTERKKLSLLYNHTHITA